MAGLRTYKPLGRGARPNLALVRDRVAPVTDLAAVRAAADDKAGRKARRAADRAELAQLAGQVREFPPGAGEDLDDPEFPAEVRDMILGRLRPGRCDLVDFDAAGCWGPVQAHHIRPKGAGGTRQPIGVASNGLGICDPHHQWIHNGRPLRAMALGLLRTKYGEYANGPLSLDGGHTWILLDDEGGYQLVPAPLDAA